MATSRAFGGLPQECVLWAGFARPGLCSVCSSAAPGGRRATPWLVCAPTGPWGDVGGSSSPGSPRTRGGFGRQWALLVALRDGRRQPCPEGETQARAKRGSGQLSYVPSFQFSFFKACHVPLAIEVSRPQCCRLLQCLCRDGECVRLCFPGGGWGAGTGPCSPCWAPCTFLFHLFFTSIVQSCPIHTFDSPAPGS